MSTTPDKGRDELLLEYAVALREFLAGAGEPALTRSYMLGRKAANNGVGLLDMAMLHHEALNRLDAAASPGAWPLLLAAQFLAESLSPFEMTLRAYQENVRLLGLDQTVDPENRHIDRSREQLRVILDATTAVIYLKDAGGRYLFVNRAYQEVFGRRREEVIGRTDREVLPPELAEALLATDRRVLDGRTPTELEETVLLPGGPRTFLSLKFPLMDGGDPYGLCCVSTDITARKERDDVLRRAIEAAETANRELESFSYSVAHDLRSPLRAIDGFGFALLEDCGDRLGAQGQKHLQCMRDAANHMADLIDGLLALARVARGTLHRDRVGLSAMCRGIAERLQESDPSRSVTFEIQEAMVADADGRLLRAMLENLIGNAWKFSSKAAAARIEIGARLDGPTPVFFVRDNGAGFDMKYANKLFGAFQRLHAPTEFEGTGIGLATVERIVKRHGGRVWAEAEVGRGATFYFTLAEAAGESPDPRERGAHE